MEDVCKKTGVFSMTTQRALIFAIISLDYVLAYFHKGAGAAVGTEIMNDLALLPDSLGLMSSAYFWSYAAMALPAGILSDRFGARKTLGIFVFLAGVGIFVFSLATNVTLLVAGRLFIGFGAGAVYVAAMKFVTDWYHEDELATCSGILLAAGNIGALLATTPLVLLVSLFYWRASFEIIGVITILAILLSYWIVRNKPADLGYVSKYKGDAVSSSKTVKIKDAVRIVLGKKKFYLLALFSFSYYGTFMGFGALWGGPYLQQVYHLTTSTMGIILMLFPIGMIVGCPLSGYISDKVLKSRKKVLMYGCITHICCYVPFILFTASLPVPILYVLFFLYGLTGGAFVSCFACGKELYDSKFAGTANGALVIFVSLGGAFYQYAMGVALALQPMVAPGIYSSAAYHSAFFVPVIGLVLGLVALTFFKEETV